MPAYRNRPDRRKVNPLGPEPLSNPIMTFTKTAQPAAEVIRFTFSEDLITVDLTDPDVLNSVRIWWPQGDFSGVAASASRISSTVIEFVFDNGPAIGDGAAVWIYDQRNFFRGASTGARCTGNPDIFEGT